MVRSSIYALLVDPNEEDAALLAAALTRATPARIEVDRVARLADVVERLERAQVDVLLVDATRPSARDLEAIRRLAVERPRLPILVLCGADDGAFALAAVEAGAQDSLPKGRLSAEFLGRAIAYAVERQRLLAEVRDLALLDDLTGLLNRRGFLTLGGHQLRLATRQRQPVWLLFADLDGMKRINDAYGHAAGDRALAEAAEVLRDTFRDSDTIGRVGGDEFAVLAVEGSRGDRDGPRTRLARALEARSRQADLPFPLWLSVGVVRRVPEAGTTIEALLALADERMYADKRARAVAPRAETPTGGDDHDRIDAETGSARHRDDRG